MSFNYCFNLGELTQFAGKLQPRSLRFLLIVSLSVGLNPAGSGSGVFLIGDTAAPTKDPISVQGDTLWVTSWGGTDCGGD